MLEDLTTAKKIYLVFMILWFGIAGMLYNSFKLFNNINKVCNDWNYFYAILMHLITFLFIIFILYYIVKQFKGWFDWIFISFVVLIFLKWLRDRVLTKVEFHMCDPLPESIKCYENWRKSIMLGCKCEDICKKVGAAVVSAAGEAVATVADQSAEPTV